MVNLEEIRGEHKKLYKTPVMEVEYLTWADIVTTSDLSNQTEAVDPTVDVGGGGGYIDNPFPN